jgi:hypothetical protein
MNFAEDLIKYLESIIVLFTIPFAYLETRESKYEKLIDIIDQLSDVILNRISNDSVVSKHEIESLLNSYLLRSNFRLKSILIDDVLDETVSKIETNSFINTEVRRRLLEKLITIRLNKRSSRLSYYRFLKTNKKQIITFIVVSFLLTTFIFPEKWQVFQTLEQYKRTIYQIGIGVFITITTFVGIRLFKSLFNPKIFEGEPAFEAYSFNFLPSYYKEYLFFRSGEKTLKLNLKDVIYDIQEKIVETDPGCMSFGIAKFYKKLRRYQLVFHSDNAFLLDISITKVSMANGTIDLDKITYTINDSSKPIHHSFYPSICQFRHLDLKEDFLPFSNNFGIEQGYRSIGKTEKIIVLDNSKKFKGLYLDNEFWDLDISST